jgi:serine/threonine protein kinase/tetratricopeptide (TPR) repeat protein
MADAQSVTRLRVDQNRRWQEGERVQVEAYLDDQPGLRADPEAVLDLIYNEIVLREEQGDRPQLEEYVRRFPQFAEHLRLQFDVHQLFEDGTKRVDMDHEPAPVVLPHGGQTFAEYELLRELGRGGMGVVYLARHGPLKRLVALKMILSGAFADAKDRARFRTEAEAVARLQHPHIVQIYDVGEENGLPFFALEYVDGLSLDRFLGSRPQPVGPSAQLLETLARAVHYAHQQGIVHRDLKPANILLAGVRGQAAGAREDTDSVSSRASNPWPVTPIPKITDFGLALQLDEASLRTPMEAFIGTPSYMAPEQAAARVKEIGPQSDVYALGAILYQALTGRPPFQGQTMLETLAMVRDQDPPPPTRWQAEVPADLEVICLKCLEKEPAKRYGSALDLAEDLRRFLSGEPIGARPVSRLERTVKWVRRRPWVAAFTAVSAAAALALAVGIPWHFVNARAKEEQGGDAKWQAVQQARATFRYFFQLQEEAFFPGFAAALTPDQDPAADLQQTTDKVRQALALVRMTLAEEDQPSLDPHWSPREQEAIRGGCYHLLMALAEAQARPLPHQSGGDERRQLRQALQLVDRAARLEPKMQAHHLRRARYLRRLGDEAAADRERRQAAGVQPTDMVDFFLRGEEEFQYGDARLAVRDFEKALVLEPADFWSRCFLGCCYLKLGQPAAAQSRLSECIAQRPEFVWAYVLRALADTNKRDFDGAQADLRHAWDLKPNEEARYFLLVSRGHLHFRKDELADAVADLKEAITLKPNLFHAHDDLAHVYARAKDYESAALEFAEVLRLQPPRLVRAEPYVWRSHSLVLQQKFEEAVQACDASLRINPDAAVAYGLRALALLNLKRFAEAVKSFDQYLAKGGRPVVDFYVGRGYARQQLADYLGARDDYSHALDLQPEASDLYLYRGWAYFFADAWKPAQRDFADALRLSPDLADAYVGRGLAQAMQGLHEKALVDAGNALRLEPDTPEMMHNVACIFALAAGAAAAQSDAASQAQAIRLQEESVKTLRKALMLLPPAQRRAFWRDKMLPDKALDSIRRGAAFRKLEVEMASPG